MYRFVELAKKMSASSRFSTWFPLRLERREGLRPGGEKYKNLPGYICERHYKSPP